jgi:ribose 5-phosphate isomerase B
MKIRYFMFQAPRNVPRGLKLWLNKRTEICMAGKIRIAIGADHGGFELKEKARQYLAAKGCEVQDVGTHSTASVDYPDFAQKVAEQVAAQRADFGVVICGTGLGVAMTANKVRGIRAAPCNDTLSAHFARSHNDANVLTMGGRMICAATAEKILDIWLATPFEGGRHQRRVDKIAAVGEKDPREKKA